MFCDRIKSSVHMRQGSWLFLRFHIRQLGWSRSSGSFLDPLSTCKLWKIIYLFFNSSTLFIFCCIPVSNETVVYISYKLLKGILPTFFSFSLPVFNEESEFFFQPVVCLSYSHHTKYLLILKRDLRVSSAGFLSLMSQQEGPIIP